MKSGLNQFNKKLKIEFCSMCGAIRGDFWETQPTRSVLLGSRPRYEDITQFWILCDECDEGLRGSDDSPQNLRAVCTNCNEGLQNTALPKPDQIHLLAQIRRPTINDQQAVLRWLLQKFSLEVKEKH